MPVLLTCEEEFQTWLKETAASQKPAAAGAAPPAAQATAAVANAG